MTSEQRLAWLLARRQGALESLHWLIPHCGTPKDPVNEAEQIRLDGLVHVFDTLIKQERQREQAIAKAKRDAIDEAVTFSSRALDPPAATCSLEGAASPWQWSWRGNEKSFSDMRLTPTSAWESADA